MVRSDVATRFWEKVERTGGCWLWTGGRSTKGYAYAWNGERVVLAHRMAYEMVAGPIPDGLQLDHVAERGCTNKHCVNPAHLEPVTLQENLRRGTRNNGQAAKTHCKRGHPFSEANTHRTAKQRHCRQCARDRQRAYRAVAA